MECFLPFSLWILRLYYEIALQFPIQWLFNHAFTSCEHSFYPDNSLFLKEIVFEENILILCSTIRVEWKKPKRKKKKVKTKITKRVNCSWSVGEKEDRGCIQRKQTRPLTWEETISLFHTNRAAWQPRLSLFHWLFWCPLDSVKHPDSVSPSFTSSLTAPHTVLGGASCACESQISHAVQNLHV